MAKIKQKNFLFNNTFYLLMNMIIFHQLYFNTNTLNMTELMNRYFTTNYLIDQQSALHR